MNTRKVDVAIIGAGTAGLAAYRSAKSLSDNVVVIEGGIHGTTCARVGCMPSKLLIAAAEAKHRSSNNELFGIESIDPKVNGKKVFERVRAERDRFAGFVVASVDAFPEEDKISGYAEFVDDNTLRVGQTTIIAKSIVIATGSRPSVPAMFHAAEDRLLVNDDVFELQDIPKKLAVFGPGVIGIELGQSLSRLGSEVNVFGLGGGIAAIQDNDISEYAIQTFEKEFYLDVEASVSNIRKVDNGVEITFLHRQKGEVTEVFDYLIAATGRRPNIDKIGIENTSVNLDERGMPKFDRFTMQIEDSSIFIAGDVNNDIPLLHEAADEGKIAGENAARFPNLRAGKRRAPLGIVFSDPQIMSVGASRKQLDRSHCNCYGIGQINFEDQGRSRVMGVNKGLLNVYAEQGTGLFLGAAMIGPSAEHIAHLLAWALQQRMTISQMLEMPFYHPVIEEGLRTALRDVNAKIQLGPSSLKNCLDCGAGA